MAIKTVNTMSTANAIAMTTAYTLVVESMPPVAEVEEDWSGFPTVVRIVDRGDPANRTSDMGAMELYAASVVASDPFRVAEALRAG